MDYFGQSNIYKDIVISKGLRFNDQTNNLVIQKPGEDDGGAGKIVIPYGTDLTNIGSRLTTLESEGLTIEKIDTVNPFVGISKLHKLQEDYTNFPGERNNTTFFEYCKVVNPYYHNIKNFGVFVKAKESVSIGNMFLMDKQTCITEIGNKIKGLTNLIGKLYLTNNNQSTEVSCLLDGIQFTKKDSPNDKVIIPYGRDLTSFYKTTFPQSFLDNGTINNPQINLYDKITKGQKFSTTIKTTIGENVFRKTITLHTLKLIYLKLQIILVRKC
jgi:hypothetical protein